MVISQSNGGIKMIKVQTRMPMFSTGLEVVEFETLGKVLDYIAVKSARYKNLIFEIVD